MTRRVIAVVGMHRSGTSAMTRALGTLGVTLGDDFLPLMPEVNEKGFWEDRALNALNIDVLSAVGTDWFSNRRTRLELLAAPRLEALSDQAATLLERRLGAAACFAFKDPRTTVLLPFWKGVFAKLAIEPAYLISLRHPASVVDSIEKRNGFAPAKIYGLWLRHAYAALKETQGSPRLVVDFDLLMDQPLEQLARIAALLNLDAGDHAAQQEFAARFLSKELRHSRYDAERLRDDPAAGPLVLDLFLALQGLARDELRFDAPELAANLDHAGRLLADLEPFLAYADDLERWLTAGPSDAIAERRVSALNAAYGSTGRTVATAASLPTPPETGLAPLLRRAAARARALLLS